MFAQVWESNVYGSVPTLWMRYGLASSGMDTAIRFK